MSLQLLALLDSPRLQRDLLAGSKTRPLTARQYLALLQAESSLARAAWTHPAAQPARPAQAPPGGGTSYQDVDPPPGEAGSGFSVTAVVSGAVGTMTLDVGGEGFAARCPNTIGDVAGHGRARFRQQLELRGPTGAKVGFSIGVDSIAQATGHVGKSGKLTDYDMVVTTTVVIDRYVVAQNGTVRHDPPVTYGDKWAFFQIVPPAQTSKLFAAGNSNLISPQALSSARSGSIDFDLLGAIGVGTVAGKLEAAFTAAQQVWYDQAACLKAIFAPDSLDKLPGGSGPVKVSVEPVTGGAPVDMLLNASAYSGIVEPRQAATHGRSPATFHFKADTHSRNGPYIHVEGVSQRGRVSDSVIGGEPPIVAVRFNVSSSANVTLAYDHSSGSVIDRGTFSEQRDIALHSLVSLTGSYPNAVGGAPLTWQRSSWTTDDNNTATAQVGLCTIDFANTLTSGMPGTLQVKSLKEVRNTDGKPTATLDIVMSGASENWHNQETLGSGLCPVFSSDTAQNSFENEWLAMHGPAGDTINPSAAGSFEVTMTSGWKLGTGDVFASRTLTATTRDFFRDGSAPDAVHWTETIDLIQKAPGT